MLGFTRTGSANGVLSSPTQLAETLGLRPEDYDSCRSLRWRKAAFTAHYLTDDAFAAFDSAEADHPVAADEREIRPSNRAG